MVDIILVAVAHSPRSGFCRASFMNLSERCHCGAKKSGVFNEANTVVDMNYLVIPGHLLPNRILARYMGDELAFGTLFLVLHERHVRCIESVRRTIDKGAQRVFGNYSFQFLRS